MSDSIYADAGVIGKNPSSIAGTWAYCLHGESFQGKSGILLPAMKGVVTNNQTEMLAIIKAFDVIPDYWTGTIYSDSMVTIGRIKNGKKGLQVGGWEWKNIPTWMYIRYNFHRNRLVNFKEFQYVQLDGHPTKTQLETGIGKRGNPVSKWNVWCDKKCKEIGEAFTLHGTMYKHHTEEE